MISCAAIQKLERYGYLGLKRHSTEDFVSTSVKDAKRSNVYALTLRETWQETAAAIRGHEADISPSAAAAVHRDGTEKVTDAAMLTRAPARFTDALVYALSFAVALTTQHIFEVRTAGSRVHTAATAKATAVLQTPSNLFPDAYDAALQLLTTLKEVSVAVGSGRALRSNASSDDFTKAVAALLGNVLDLVLVLLATCPKKKESNTDDAAQHEQLLAQGLVMVASVTQTLRRVQASYPVADLYATRPCAALLKQVANKHKQQQKQQQQQKSAPSPLPAADKERLAAEGTGAAQQPLLALLQQYVDLYAQTTPTSATGFAAALFSSFSLFQRLSMLHGALSAVPGAFSEDVCCASRDVQHWLRQLLASTACNRATRYVVYFREDELRLMQHNIRQASEYALYTFTTTPPVDPGLVESLLGTPTDNGAPHEQQQPKEEKESNDLSGSDAMMHARAALVLAQWCVSAPFFFESFCQDETWAAFAQEQRRLVLLQQSRARRGLEKSSSVKKSKKKSTQHHSDESGSDGASESGSRSSSVSSRTSDDDDDAKSVASNASADAMSLRSFQTASHLGSHSVAGGSVTSLASRVSLLSTFSKHSAASYLSFLSVLRPSTAGSVAGGNGGGGGNVNGSDDAADNANERQMHESEDGNTNLPLILLEQLTLGLHRFMESYPSTLLDAYGLRSISWSSIARMFAFVEASLTSAAASSKHRRLSSAATTAATSLPQPLFNLAQDIRYNKGMGYECLGLLFAKAVAPLLDVQPATAATTTTTAEEEEEETADTMMTVTSDGSSGSAGIKKKGAALHSVDAGKPTSTASGITKKPRMVASSDSDSAADEQNEENTDLDSRQDTTSEHGGRSEDEFFANAAANAAATVGRASLSPTDSIDTRRRVEEALSTCLTAYESVAPQVVDMNLPTILRLAARTATTDISASTQEGTERNTATWSNVLLTFLEDITRRLGRNNELPHLVDALLGRGEGRTASSEASLRISGDAADALQTLQALRSVFHLAPVRRALTEAAGMSLDPESLVLHLSSIAAELEEAAEATTGTTVQQRDSTDSASDEEAEEEEHRKAGVAGTTSANSAWVQRMLLSLEVMEAVLHGIFPMSVSASAVLEQTTQLELLLTASFMKCVAVSPSHVAHALAVQHALTIRQCRAVTALCLQDLGSQQVQEYLLMLDDTLWQLSSDVGLVLGSFTVTQLQSIFVVDSASSAKAAVDDVDAQLLLPSLVLQRLSLARAVTGALSTTAGPSDQLHEMVAYVWDVISGKPSTDSTTRDSKNKSRCAEAAAVMLANQMRREDWISLVALGKEKHARAAIMALLTRMSATATTTMTVAVDAAWLSCCLHSIPGTTLRALVDVYVTLSIDDACDNIISAPHSTAYAQWMAVARSLISAYGVVGHNPYWPSMLAHTARALLHVARVWRKACKGNHQNTTSHRRSKIAVDDGADGQDQGSSASPVGVAQMFAELAEQLLALMLCVLRGEERAGEVMRKTLLQRIRDTTASETAAAADAGKAHPPVLSRSGMSVSYVESIKVPATVLSDLSAPPSLISNTDATTASDDTQKAELAALKALSFEDEMQDLCEVLFQANVVKALFQLTDLAPSALRSVSAMCMGTLALLYQVSLATAQAAWRSRATNGSLTALQKSVVVTFVQGIAETFYTRAASSTPLTGAACNALLSFLASFHAVEDQHLYLHVASQRTTSSSSSSNTVECGVLDAVEAYWKSIFCRCAAGLLDSTSSSPPLSTQCEVFNVLFACVLASAQHKQQQMSRGGHSSSSDHAKNGHASSKRPRQGDEESAPHLIREEEKRNAEVAALLGATGGVADIFADVLSRNAQQNFTEADEEAQTGNVVAAATQARCNEATSLRVKLSTFFGFNLIDASTCRGVKAEEEDEEVQICGDNATSSALSFLSWRQLSCATSNDDNSDGGDDGECGVCAWWLLWKLFTVSATLPTANATSTAEGNTSDGASARAAAVRVHRAAKAFLVTRDADPRVDESERDTVALRALCRVLRVLPADAVPSLLLEHVQSLFDRVIPSTQGNASTASASASAIAAAAELLLALFQVRPRLPAWRLLPHAQRLLVWLTHPSARAATSQTAAAAAMLSSREKNGKRHRALAGPSLASLSIRLCAAVSAHPAVNNNAHAHRNASAPSSSVSNGSGSLSLSSSSLPVITSELLDNVWLLLLSLCESDAPSTSTAAAPALALSEAEMIQLLLLLTKTWRNSRHQQLWSRPAMLPPVMAALFASLMRGMEAGRYTPRVLNVLAGGLAAVAAHVDAATAAGDVDANGSDAENEEEEKEEDKKTTQEAPTGAEVGKGSSRPARKQHKSEVNKTALTTTSSNDAERATKVPAQLKRMTLAATTTSIFEVAQHYVHVFTTHSSDMDFLFTDFLRVLSEHFLPKVTRPPIAYHAGVRIGGTTQSEMTFADLAYMCVGNAESKSLLKQAALRMEEEEGGAAGSLGLTDGSRSIFHVA